MLLCSGDEDRATQGRRRRALSRAQHSSDDVVVDLTGLHFADSSFVLDLALLAGRLRERGSRVLLHHPQPQISRLIEMIGLLSQPGVALATA